LDCFIATSLRSSRSAGKIKVSSVIKEREKMNIIKSKKNIAIAFGLISLLALSSCELFQGNGVVDPTPAPTSTSTPQPTQPPTLEESAAGVRPERWHMVSRGDRA
jgi:hypothetical protein